MSQPPIRGLGPEDSTDRRKLRRDIRSPIIRRLAKIGQGVPVACGLVVLMILELVWPQSLLFWLWAMVVLLIAHHLEILKALPLKLPQSAQRVDPHDPGPGRQSWKKAEGKIFLGHDVDSGQEMWISERDLLTHMLLLGTTGSGKTEALISLSLNALITGSGLFYIDPKAAPSLAVQIWQMARLLGRDDDFRVLNFGTPRPDLNLHNRLSNTNNPFSCGTADSLTQILASLMPPTKNGPNSVFAEKAMNLIAGLLQALVDLRDQGRLILSVAKIRQYLSVEFCLSLLDDPYISNSSRSALRSALQTCNWSESRPLALQSAFFEQFGYAQSYFGRALSSLTDTYGHIYGVETGEVDFQDVVLNRRILVVLLPSLEKSPLELASLGKISLSSLKAACAVGLGVEIEGPENETLAALPLNFTGSGPFLAIVDEYAAIVTPGFEMVLTQGRGLGIAAIIASQDYAGLVEADSKGAQQIVSNTNLKVFMKLADPEKTWALIRNLSGEEPVLRTSGYEVKSEAIAAYWRDNMAAVVEMTPVSVLRDLMEQTEGEAHCVYHGHLTRARLFFANILTKKAFLRVPRLIQID